MSRQPTWDLALGLQADMFRAVKEVGGLIVYFRGYGETRASKWVNDPEALARLMNSTSGRYTQIRKVLTHARREAEQQRSTLSCMWAITWRRTEMSKPTGRRARLVGVYPCSFQEGRELKLVGVQGDRPIDPWCLLSLRGWFVSAVTRTALSRGGLCDGWSEGSARLWHSDEQPCCCSPP